MGELSSAERHALPKSDFAIPEKAPDPDSYPIPDEDHARDALARVSEYGDESEQEQVRAAVHAKFPDIEIED